LVDIVGVLAADPRPGVVLVISADDRLVGWIREERLDADLMLMVLPDAAPSAAAQLGAQAARGLMQTAADLMTEACSVTIRTPIKDALAGMAQAGTHAAALVDDQQRLLGYVTLPDIMRDLLTWGG
jgi:CBS-domain-containing membrane protein